MKFKVGVAQMTPVLGDLKANLEKVLTVAGDARREKVDLLVYPELALSGYFVKDMVPEVALRPDSADMVRLAKGSRDLSLAVGFVEEGDDHRFFNSVAYLEEGELKAIHRKVYLPTYGMFEEERYFARGETVRAFSTRFGRLGMLICEDYWHLSLPYLLALDGARIMLGVAASPGRGLGGSEVFTSMETTRSLGRVWAKLLSVYYIFANRVGFEDGVNFWGGSEVIEPTGNVIGQAPEFDEHLLVVTADTESVRRERVTSAQLRDEDLDLTMRELRRIMHERYKLELDDNDAPVRDVD